SAEAQRAAMEAVLKERVDREVAHAKRTLAKIEGDNPDLARDEFARAALERQVFAEYGEDLKALSIPVDEIPQDPLTRASWHNQLRATGAPVRDIGTILGAAVGKFRAWKGAPRLQQHRP